MQVLRPGTERELGQLLAEASAAGAPIEVIGAGSKRAVGRPMQTAATLTTSSLRGVSLYEPTELVMSALSGTPLSRIEAELASMGQMLAFEPIDLGPVLGQPAGQTTIGAVFATNLGGSRRISTGAPRDHLLGIRAITGNGQTFRSGGRVMKNVTGYDLTRLVAGSWGTLAVLSEVSFKVLPVSEAAATVLLRGLGDEAAIESLCHAMGTPVEVSGAVHLQPSLARRLRSSNIASDGRSLTALRLENFTRALSQRVATVSRELAPFADAQVLEHTETTTFWQELRQLTPLQGSEHPLWRISTTPTAGPRVVAAITRFMEAHALYDWSGGLVWLEVLPTSDAGAADIRRVIASHGGHATLVRANPSIRASVEVFQPLDPALAAITRGIKAVFDPANVLNPGRMYDATAGT